MWHHSDSSNVTLQVRTGVSAVSGETGTEEPETAPHPHPACGAGSCLLFSVLPAFRTLSRVQRKGSYFKSTFNPKVRSQITGSRTRTWLSKPLPFFLSDFEVELVCCPYAVL